MVRRGGLLNDIESGALDPESDLPTLLRKCISLGGVTGSEGLRTWATLELKGYEGEDLLPVYRKVTAPLVLDGVAGFNRVSGQAVPANMIPDFAREAITTTVSFPQPISEIADLLSSARSRGESSVNLGPPGGQELVALINADLASADPRLLSGTRLPPSQIVERIYWTVSLAPISRILDVVRTTLVELVAEMRAGTPTGEDLPSREIAEQAVEIAIHGKGNRIVVNQVAPLGQAAGAAGSGASVGAGEPETAPRKLMWWLVGFATLITAVASVWILFL